MHLKIHEPKINAMTDYFRKIRGQEPIMAELENGQLSWYEHIMGTNLETIRVRKVKEKEKRYAKKNVESQNKKNG